MAIRAGGVYYDISPELAPGFEQDSAKMIRAGLDPIEPLIRRLSEQWGDQINRRLRDGAEGLDDGVRVASARTDDRLRDSLGRFVARSRDAGKDAGDNLGGGAASGLESGLESAASGLGSSFSPAGIIGGAILGGLGLVAGVFLDQLGASMGREVSLDQLTFRLGLTEQEAATYGAAAGELYADAYGESLDDVYYSIEATSSTLGEMLPWTQQGLEDVTARVMDLASGFEFAAEDIALNARIIADTGTGSVYEALDVLYLGLQGAPMAVRDAMMEAVHEYSTFAYGIGITSEELIAGTLGVAHEGEYVMDKFGDSIKEFGILTADSSEKSAEAFERLGFNAEHMFDIFAAGGPEARRAFDDVTTALLDVEDSSERVELALLLFGTPLEDMTTQDIPKVLEGFRHLEDGLGDVEGALVDAGADLNDNTSTWLETIKRGFWQPFNNWMDAEVNPRVGELAEAFEMGGWEGLEEKWAEMWPEIEAGLNTVWPKLGAWWDETGYPFVTEKLAGLVEAVTEWALTEGVPAMQRASNDLFMGLVSGFGSSVADGAKMVALVVHGVFAAGWNMLAIKWNGLKFPEIGPWSIDLPDWMGGGSWDFGPVGGWDLPDLPLIAPLSAEAVGLAAGGLLMAPTMLTAHYYGGEAGPEAVWPLDKLEDYLDRRHGDPFFRPRRGHRPAVELDGRPVGRVVGATLTREERYR